MSTLIDGLDYGPLACLIGTWSGDKGIDIAPEEEGEERNPYYETIVFEASGEVSNADEQTLAIVRYHQIVQRASNDKVFHNESGYLTWEASSDIVTQSFVIPRGVAVIAGGSGRLTDTGAVIDVKARLDGPDYTIAQAPFMRDHASTKSFTHHVEVDGDEMSYHETTLVDIFGRVFDHTDQNTLQRIMS